MRRIYNMEKELINILKIKGVSDRMIDNIINSGYIIRHWQDFKTAEGYITISDKMYGNKGISSSFDIDKFIQYANGHYVFEKLPKLNSHRVKNLTEINEILNEPYRKRWIENGWLSFRGQVKEYTFKRKIPNPVRADMDGKEISILPGAFRDKPLGFNRQDFADERNSFELFLRELEPNNPHVYSDSYYSYDIMRAEQHYAKHTQGLDISFEISTALFFATNKLNWNTDGTAYHSEISQGNHEGVIYSFVFRDPLVKKTEFLIKDFDLFKTYSPARILRQNCGLPLFSEYDRNIAVCDIDCVFYLDENFDYPDKLRPSYMFPDESEDLFYGKLLDLKRKYNGFGLDNVIEYKH